MSSKHQAVADKDKKVHGECYRFIIFFLKKIPLYSIEAGHNLRNGARHYISEDSRCCCYQSVNYNTELSLKILKKS